MGNKNSETKKKNHCVIVIFTSRNRRGSFPLVYMYTVQSGFSIIGGISRKVYLDFS